MARQLEELQRHNGIMEDCGVYFALYKRKQGVVEKKMSI